MQDSKSLTEAQSRTTSIHNIPDLIPNSIEISNGIYWGFDWKELINNGKINKHNIRFLGYTGWKNSN
jgi:putative transcriptional regulator